MRNNLTRRRFLTIGGGSALWLASGCRSDALVGSPPVITKPLVSSGLASTTAASEASLPAGASNRVLVLVQLLGGNDALNTLVPTDGRYRDSRPSVFLDDSELLGLTGLNGYGFHPSLGPLARFWDEERLAIAAGTGFAKQTRSHFESRDVWWRATDDVSADGWLARWMDVASIDQPDEPLEAIALGVGPRALAGSTASAVSDPSNFVLTPPTGMSALDYERFLLAVSLASPGSESSAESDALAAARGSLPVALSTQKILEDLGDASASDPYADQVGVGLDVQLRTAAALISTRPGLRVVTVGVDGFDTHSNQLQTQASLLEEAALAIADFWESLPEADQARTLMMTTSEFGRRVVENGSGGTDHGRGGIQFLIGGRARSELARTSTENGPRLVGGQLVGALDLKNLQDGDLPIKVDTQDLFAEALRWLGGPVEEVLGINPPATSLLG